MGIFDDWTKSLEKMVDPWVSPAKPTPATSYNSGDVGIKNDDKWYQRSNWDSLGGGFWGNRAADNPTTDDKGNTVAPKSSTFNGPPKVGQVDFSKLPTTYYDGEGTKLGKDEAAKYSGRFSSEAYGTWSTDEKDIWGPKYKYDAMGGKSSLDLGGWSGVAGIERKEGWKGYAESVGDYGTAVAKGEAGAVANAGADAYWKMNSSGFNAGADASAKAGLYAQGDADLKSKGLHIEGVDKDLTAGIGVHGDTFVGAKLGAGGQIGVGPEFVGAKGNIGGFVGAEGAVDVHGNLGPLGGKLGASGMAGLGAGAEGDISYKDGKFHIGGKLFAALGYGGSLSGDVTIDVKQAYQMAEAGAKYLGPAGDVLLGGLRAGGDLALGAGKGLADVVGGTVHGIGDVAHGIGAGVSDVAGGIYHGVGEAGSGILSGVGDVASGFGAGFHDLARGDVLGAIGDVGSGIGHGLYDAGSGVLSGAGTLVSGIGHGIYDVGSGLVHGVGDVASGIGHGIYDVGSGIVAGVGDVASGIGSGVSHAASAVGSAIGSVLSW